MTFGIDYATVTPDPKALAAKGVKFVCRYVSTVGNPKNVTAAEVKALKAAGVDVVVVFETTANRALDGFAAGAQDAHSARQQTVAAGLRNCVVYFAVDFDLQDAQVAQVVAYFKGVASVLGKRKSGVYGGLKAVKVILDGKIVKYAWQTYAWSGEPTVWDKRAQLRQVLNAQNVCNINCDHDNAVAVWYGQTPGPIKKHVKKAVWVVVNGLHVKVGSPLWKWLKKHFPKRVR